METQVTFSCEGESLFGVLHLPEQAPAPGLLMCHGFTGHKAEAHRLFVAAAREFAASGLGVLRFDFRGSGDSAGEFREMTVSREIADAEAAFEFLCSQEQVDANRVGVLGLSLGGCVAACLTGREDRIRALVLWAAVAHAERIYDQLAPDFAGQQRLDLQGWEVGRAFLEELTQIQPLKDVAEYAGPSLVVHGGADEVVPPSDGSDYRVALGGRCQLHLVAGADHVFSGLGWKSEAIAVTRDFLVETLGTP